MNENMSGFLRNVVLWQREGMEEEYRTLGEVAASCSSLFRPFTKAMAFLFEKLRVLVLSNVKL